MRIHPHLTTKILIGIGLLFSPILLCAEVAYQNRNVRFTLISPSCVRLEWSATGQFTDLRSLLATERQYDSVPFSLTKKGRRVIIRTSEMQITYRISKDSLSASNLSITPQSINHQSINPSINWHPGLRQDDNLKGTYRTLDRCIGDQWYIDGRHSDRHQTIQLEDGLLARCGWTLLNDSHNLLFDNDSIAWWQQRPDTTAQDWYFLLYGHDYKKALKDFTRFAGSIPVPPSFALGYWWSREWRYNAQDIRDLVANFRQLDIPLDVMVIDMFWHNTDKPTGGWTGYSWNAERYPDPEGLLKELHDQGIRVTLNLHPADGIAPVEPRYAAFAAALGDTTGDTIPWQSSNKLFMTTWADSILRPLEKQGVDFWWLDWQQFKMDKAQPKLSNTWWLNYFVYTDAQRQRGDQALLYHRWGGLGNHRYQIGFSGDTYAYWPSLKYLPYFNATASNVLYGWWSHDMGGFMLRDLNEQYNTELYMRWFQFGVFSPILRTHSSKNPKIHKEPWLLNDTVQQVIRSSVQLRNRLRPYIMEMAQIAHETGVSLCRPLYYDYPEADEAYAPQWRNQYLFGDDILIAPVTDPMQHNLSTLDIWLPEGDWIEIQSGETLSGNQIITRSYSIFEYPVFIKAQARERLQNVFPILQPSASSKVQAYPGWVTVTQPDGSALTIKTIGDEWMHYFINREGKKIAQTPDGWWKEIE